MIPNEQSKQSNLEEALRCLPELMHEYEIEAKTNRH